MFAHCLSKCTCKNHATAAAAAAATKRKELGDAGLLVEDLDDKR